MSLRENASRPAGACDACPSWRPMSTAPRDGTNILIRFGSDTVSQAKYVAGLPHAWKLFDSLDGVTWAINHAIDNEYGPKQWMPMPGTTAGTPNTLDDQYLARMAYSAFGIVCEGQEALAFARFMIAQDRQRREPDKPACSCETCRNKRCSHATDHRNACTKSNEAGQPGSSWEHANPFSESDAPPSAPAVDTGVTEREAFDVWLTSNQKYAHSCKNAWRAWKACAAPSASASDAAAGEPVAHMSPDRLAKIAANPAHVETPWSKSPTNDGLENIALYTAPPAASGRKPVAWKNSSTFAILRDESSDMCDRRREEWQPLAYADRWTRIADVLPTELGNHLVTLAEDKNFELTGEYAIQVEFDTYKNKPGQFTYSNSWTNWPEAINAAVTFWMPLPVGSIIKRQKEEQASDRWPS